MGGEDSPGLAPLEGAPRKRTYVDGEGAGVAGVIVLVGAVAQHRHAQLDKPARVGEHGSGVKEHAGFSEVRKNKIFIGGKLLQLESARPRPAAAAPPGPAARPWAQARGTGVAARRWRCGPPWWRQVGPRVPSTAARDRDCMRRHGMRTHPDRPPPTRRPPRPFPPPRPPRATALVAACGSSAALPCAGEGMGGCRARASVPLSALPLLRLRGAGRQAGRGSKGGAGGRGIGGVERDRAKRGAGAGGRGSAPASQPPSFQRLLDEQRGRGDGLAGGADAFDGARGFRGKRARDAMAANEPPEGGHSDEVRCVCAPAREYSAQVVVRGHTLTCVWVYLKAHACAHAHAHAWHVALPCVRAC